MTVTSVRKASITHRLKSLTGAALLFAAVAASVPAVAEVHYRWLNERGTPVHSDRPPPKGVDYEVVSTDSGLKRVVSGEEGAVPLEVKSRVGNEFESVDTEEDQRGQKNPELCQRARDNLDALENSDNLRMRNDEGEVRGLTPEDVETQSKLAQAQIGVYCE